jgi:hypothetical protein
MERSTHFLWENPLFLWPFSIAFCMFTRGYSGYPGCLHKKLGSHWAVDGKDLADFAILDLRGEGIGLSTVRAAQPSLPICCSFHKLFIYIYMWFITNRVQKVVH